MNKNFKKLMTLALALMLMLSVLMLTAAADNDDPVAVTAPNPEDMQILSAPAPDGEPLLGAAPAPGDAPAPGEVPANDLTPPDVVLPEGEYVLTAPEGEGDAVAIQPQDETAPAPDGVPENAVDGAAPAADAAEPDGNALVWIIVAAVVVVAAVAFLVIKKKK